MSDLYYFIKYYLYLIILFSIIFYILLYINHNTKNNIIIVETKIFFYISIFFLFIIINDILQTPLESLKKFILIIIISLIIIYIVNYLIVYYYKDVTFINKLLLVITTSLIISAITITYISLTFKNNSNKLFNAFNYSINKNFAFLIFISIYIFIYNYIFNTLNINTNLTDILTPFILGVLLIFFIFCLIIYICLKIKIINRIQILNSFIALGAIFVYLSIVCIYIFMKSLGNICNKDETETSIDNQERIILLTLLSIFIILWLDDTRNWHQIGSILFLIITLFTLYATIYPSNGLLSMWLLIEWIILIFFKKENSKNSLHYSFMNT